MPNLVFLKIHDDEIGNLSADEGCLGIHKRHSRQSLLEGRYRMSGSGGSSSRALPAKVKLEMRMGVLGFGAAECRENRCHKKRPRS